MHAPGVGPRAHAACSSCFGDAAAACAAPAHALRAAGLDAGAVEALHAHDAPAGVARDLEWAAATPTTCWRAATRATRPGSPTSPTRRPCSTCTATPEVLACPALAIVGSRHPTSAGRDTARELARHLAASGLVIVSGLALGIDAAAHRGALDADGLSVAVAGTGPDRVYPARHAGLAREIAASGAVVTELPVGRGPRAEAFPRRNRILSGLCVGTLVVEAAVRSGSLITARLALEQDREVFAIPGSIHNPVARGCHRLIRQGAKLVETADDVLEEVAPLLGDRPRPGTPAPRASPRPPTTPGAGAAADDPEYARLLEVLDWEPRGIDDLAGRSGLDVGAVASMLLRLELEGRVRVAPGGLYQRR
ncbi:MAG: DNA-processing protein DprA [Halofilum sp. (in: g-proteobacteria)]|nr:DNA-processing protein DprA [Halofilum sp. (in: g-proteobacteria)]